MDEALIKRVLPHSVEAGAPTPVSELKRFIAVMLTCGIAEAQIRDMVQKVPEEVVCR